MLRECCWSILMRCKRRSNKKNLLSKNLINYRVLSKFIGNGLVSLTGTQHTEHRRIIQPAFRLQNLKATVSTFVSQTKILCDIWRKQGDRGIDVGTDLSKLTLNIIGMSAFGFDFDSMSDDPSVGKEATAHFTSVVEGSPSGFLRFLIFVFPVLVHSPLLVQKAKKSIQYTDELVTAIIREKRVQLTEAHIDPETHQFNNLLEILLASQDSSALSDQQLADHVKTLMFAGHETTATLVLWCLFALSQEPDVAAKVKQELDQHISDYDEITYEKIEELTYLKAVIKETLRAYPPVGIVIRRMEEDFHYGGYTVPADTIAAISPYVLHHNPQWWDNPEKFDPDRWLQGKELHRYQFLPFLKGPRNCIGEKFAVLEASTILSILLKEFQFGLDRKDWEATRRKTKITMRPKPGPIMRVQPY